MSNVLKMEWFRFRKSRYAYIILIVLTLLFLFGTIMDSSRSNGATATVKQENKNSIELYTENYDTTYTTDFTEKYEMLVSNFYGNVVPMSIIIFSCLFAGAYHKNKFEKNIAGLIGNKQKLVISNLIICSMYCFIVMFVTVISSFIGYCLFYQGFTSMPAGSLMEFVKFLAVYYILLDSVAIVMSCFVQIMGNQIVALVVGLIYGSGMVYGIINFIVKVVGIQGFSIEKYVPLGTLYNMSIHNQTAYILAVLVAIIFGVSFLVINILVKNRKDIVT